MWHVPRTSGYQGTSSQVQPQPQWNGAYTQDLTEQWSEQQAQVEPQPKTRSLFSISGDLKKLNDLLDECGDDAQQQELINQWFEQLGDERDRKLDNYSALIVEMTTRAAARKAEAQRLMELATTDENRAKLLKERLKWFFEIHNLKTVETARYKLQIQRNGGKAPLILKNGLLPNELPQRDSVKISIDPDTTAIREVHRAWGKSGIRSTGRSGQMVNNSKFKLYQRVRVIAPGKWHRRIGTVWSIRSYCVDVMFTSPVPLPIGTVNTGRFEGMLSIA